jgi:hypothetical protein
MDLLGLLCTGFILIDIFGFLLMILCIKHATTGYQDENGFHFGIEGQK